MEIYKNDSEGGFSNCNRMRYERTIIKAESLVDDFKELTDSEFNELANLLLVFLEAEKVRRFGNNERPAPRISNNY